MIVRGILIVSLLLIYSLPRVGGTKGTLPAEFNDSTKELKICSIAGGLNIARLVSSTMRNLFRDALEDVEFIRECISEAAFNGGIAGGIHALGALNGTLDWRARNFSQPITTMGAGLAYSDDRKDRRVDRYVGLTNEPFVGDKESDMALIDPASNIFPWIVDRRSIEKKWYASHQNGRSTRRRPTFTQLYAAAWIGTRGEAWLYYPPTNRLYPGSHPLNPGDALGPAYNSHEEEFVKPNLPEYNPESVSYFSAPYADTAVPGLSLITAQAPIYFSGEFQGHTYNNTYIASTGVDISVASISSLLDELEDTLTEGSFAFLVDVKDFKIVTISQSTVEKIYPKRTGFEEVRVSYNTANGSILLDRRNRSYLVPDTIHQSPLLLTNADWHDLSDHVRALPPGGRGSKLMDILLRDESEPTTYYAMYERWPEVADWALIVFTPKDELDNAINVQLQEEEIDLHINEGESTTVSSVICNSGTLDVTLNIEKLPPGFILVTEFQQRLQEEFRIKTAECLKLDFRAETTGLAGWSTSFIAYTIADDKYPDCFYEHVLATKVSVKIIYEMELNQLSNIRPYGFALASVIAASALAASAWVYIKRDDRVIRASQPLFLHVICAGIAVMGTSIIPMGIDDSIASNEGCSRACMAMPWLLSLGFSLVFSALFSKVWRINQIVGACRNHKRVDVKLHHVMVPFFIIFTANVVILGLWTLLDPLVWVRETRDNGRGSDEFNSYGLCSFNDHVVSAALGASLLAVNFLALVLALMQLYRARNISIEYSESKYIAIALGGNIQVFLTGIPILVLVNDNPQVLFFVRSSLVFALTMSMLLLIFVPKVCMMGNAVLTELSNSVPESDRRHASCGGERAQRSESHVRNSVDSEDIYQRVDAGRSFENSRMRRSMPPRDSHESFVPDKTGSSCASTPPPKNSRRLPVLSDISDSLGPSEFEAADLGAKSQRNAGTPFPERSIVEEETLSKNRGSETNARILLCVNSHAKDLSTDDPDVSWTNMRKDAAKPVRLETEVQETDDSMPITESMSNAPIPQRFPPVFEYA